MHLKTYLLAITVAFASTTLLSCDDDTAVGPSGALVGGRCTQDQDCEKRCLIGSDFPSGYCSLSCQGDIDCPHGSVCIGKEDDVCLLKCELPVDCQKLGATYRCDPEDRKGIPQAKALVCIGD